MRFRSSGAKLVDNAEAKVPELVLVTENVSQRAKTITARTEVSEYEVVDQVTFRLLDAEGKPLIDTRTIRRSGVYSYQSTQVQVSESRRAAADRRPAARHRQPDPRPDADRPGPEESVDAHSARRTGRFPEKPRLAARRAGQRRGAAIDR